MTNQILTASIQSQSIGLQAPTPMQVLTLDELRAVVGGPVIDNGGIIGIATPMPNKD